VANWLYVAHQKAFGVLIAKMEKNKKDNL